MDFKPKLARFTTNSLSMRFLLDSQLLFLNRHFNVIAVSSPGADLDIVSRRENVSVYPIRMEREISLIRDLISFFNILKFLYTEKPNIIHSNTPKSSLLSMIGGFIVGTKVRVYTITGLRFEGEKGFKRELLIFMEKVTCFFATNIIAEGDGVKEIMRKNSISRKKVDVIGYGSLNGVDLVRFNKNNLDLIKLDEIKHRIKFNARNFYFLFIGRIVKDKGINELIEAFVRVSKYRENIKLILVGDFESKNNFLSQLSKENFFCNKNIIVIGFSLDVEYYLALSDCFVFPSYREGFPNVLLQAAAIGCPIICSNIPANLDIMGTNIGDNIFTIKSIQSIKNSMDYALENIAKLNINAKILKGIIEEKFSRDNVQKSLLMYYTSLLKES